MGDNRETLRLSWEQVRRNRGAAGVDRQSVERFGARSEQYLEELEQALRAGSYRPSAVKRVEIPKADGQTRCCHAHYPTTLYPH